MNERRTSRRAARKKPEAESTATEPANDFPIEAGDPGEDVPPEDLEPGDAGQPPTAGEQEPRVTPPREETPVLRADLDAGGGPRPLYLPELVLPIRVVVSVAGAERRDDAQRAIDRSVPSGIERFKMPYVDPDYSNRRGFDTGFLDLETPLPRVTRPSAMARMDDGELLIPYEHFSVVMHKRRRLCLFTASNVHGAPRMKRPEPGRDYSRDGLSGLTGDDQERWLTDPRIPERHQLPDRFFTKDGTAFDKGHVVRREDVCWGSTYQQVRVANGDTFHTTNCTPQVAGFNRSNLDGRWGELENFIAAQARTEKLSLLAGPVLAESDRLFHGVDERGPIAIQIPSRYWKVVLAAADGELRAFGFLLEQDLSDVPLEFAVAAAWREHLISLAEFEELLTGLELPEELLAADQSQSELGDELIERTHAAR